VTLVEHAMSMQTAGTRTDRWQLVTTQPAQCFSRGPGTMRPGSGTERQPRQRPPSRRASSRPTSAAGPHRGPGAGRRGPAAEPAAHRLPARDRGAVRRARVRQREPAAAGRHRARRRGHPEHGRRGQQRHARPRPGARLRRRRPVHAQDGELPGSRNEFIHWIQDVPTSAASCAATSSTTTRSGPAATSSSWSPGAADRPQRAGRPGLPRPAP
jgi:hypothetical protein